MKKLLHLILILAIVSISIIPCHADPPDVAPNNPIYTANAGVPATSITNATTAIAAVDTTITFTAPSRHVIVKTGSTPAIIYVDLTGGVATAADFQLDAGGSLTVDLPKPIDGLHYIGAAAAGTVSVCAY